MRVVDFRAGPSQAKRSFVPASRESSRSRRSTRSSSATKCPRGSRWVLEGGQHPASTSAPPSCSAAWVKSAPLDMHVPEGRGRRRGRRRRGGSDAPATPAAVAAREAHDRAEKLLVQAKKAAKDVGDKLPVPKLAELREADARRAVDKAIRAGRARSRPSSTSGATSSAPTSPSPRAGASSSWRRASPSRASATRSSRS